MAAWHLLTDHCSVPTRGSYLVEQPHEEHGQAGVEHVVEGDEPVLVCGLQGDDRVCVTDCQPKPVHIHLLSQRRLGSTKCGSVLFCEMACLMNEPSTPRAWEGCSLPVY